MAAASISLCSTVLAAFVFSSVGIAQEPPKTYTCIKAKKPLRIDGKLNDSAWKTAPWTTDFVDIEGAATPLPCFRTRRNVLLDWIALDYTAKNRNGAQSLSSFRE